MSNKRITFNSKCIQLPFHYSEQNLKSPNNFWTKFEIFGYSCMLNGDACRTLIERDAGMAIF